MKKLFFILSVSILLTSCGQHNRRSNQRTFERNAFYHCSEQAYAHGCANAVSHGPLNPRQIRSYYCERDYRMCLNQLGVQRF